MAGSRSLTTAEERLLVRRIRKINARDCALVCAQLFLGFRISEILALTIGHVLYRGRIRDRIALPPRFLKGQRGTTRSVPVGPGLQRALERYLEKRARRAPLLSEAPLFLSRQHGANWAAKPLSRSSAEKIIKRQLGGICADPQGLSTHSLRKSWASRLYEKSGHDILIVRDGLGHRSVAVTQRYLPVRRAEVDAFILQSDWTRRSPSAQPGASHRPKTARAKLAAFLPVPGQEDFAA